MIQMFLQLIVVGQHWLVRLKWMEWEETRSWKEGAGKVSLLLKSSMIEKYIINDNNSDKLNYEEGLIIEFWWKNLSIKSYLWSLGNMDLFMNFTCQWLWTSHIVCSRQRSCEVELQNNRILTYEWYVVFHRVANAEESRLTTHPVPIHLLVLTAFYSCEHVTF